MASSSTMMNEFGTATMAALRANSLEALECWLRQGAAGAKALADRASAAAPESGTTCLLYAIMLSSNVSSLAAAEPPRQAGHGVAVIQLLIKSGARLDGGNCNGQTALLQAVQDRHTDAVELLIAAGADVNRANGRRCYVRFLYVCTNTPKQR